jgi:predicted DNA-binding ArsR family transcriptional regulator
MELQEYKQVIKNKIIELRATLSVKQISKRLGLDDKFIKTVLHESTETKVPKKYGKRGYDVSQSIWK